MSDDVRNMVNALGQQKELTRLAREERDRLAAENATLRAENERLQSERVGVFKTRTELRLARAKLKELGVEDV